MPLTRESVILLLAVIFTLGVMDTFSTVAAFNDPGRIGQESNPWYKITYTDNGLWGFVALKFIVTIGFALAAFAVQLLWPELRFIYVCLSAGMIVVGVLVTASNLAIALGGNSIAIFSMDALQLSLYLLLAFFLFGVIMTIIGMACRNHHLTPRDMHSEQSGTWKPGYNGKYRI